MGESVLTKSPLQLSGNALKIIAAVTMVVDHVGYTFFPTVALLRFIGRLAFPLFAYMIAEGCVHTRSPGRYFLSVFMLAAVCQVAYTVAMQDWFLCVPVSFSMAIALILALKRWKTALFGGRLAPKLLWGAVFLGGVAGVWALTRFVHLDYGFWGCMLPVSASLLRKPENAPAWWKKLDSQSAHLIAMGVGMVLLAVQNGVWQWWSLLALPLLMLYSGKRGKHKMKYFFYIFYPAHLLVIEGLYILLNQ